MTQKKELIQLANELHEYVHLVKDNRMNLEQARAISMLANGVIKARVAAMKENKA